MNGLLATLNGMRNTQLIDLLAGHIDSLRPGRVALLTHVGGDADSIASGFVMQGVLREAGLEVLGLFIPEPVSAASLRLVQLLGIRYGSELPDADHYIALDTGSLEQLGDFRGVVADRLTIIDHHERKKGDGPLEGVYASSRYQSTSEIILELSEARGHALSEMEATALFAGIYFDTVRLTVADPETLRKVGHLGSLGARPQSLLPLLEAPIDDSERLARLKAAKRLRLYRCGELIVAMSRVGAHRASAARGLVTLGAHVAIVGDEADGVVDITLRASSEVRERYDVNLVRDVVNPLVEQLGGGGGGHASAARLSARGKLEDVAGRCVSLIAYRLGAMPSPVEG